MFNNAGIMHPQDDNALTTEERVWYVPPTYLTMAVMLTVGYRDLTMDINVKGVWFGCKHAIIAMRKNGGGSIINTASFVALMGAATPQLACKLAGLLPSSPSANSNAKCILDTASKGAVLAMT